MPYFAFYEACKTKGAAMAVHQHVGQSKLCSDQNLVRLQYIFLLSNNCRLENISIFRLSFSQLL